MILEGYRLHYDEPVVVDTPDADLALLLGDQLYALGLSRLAALGDLDAVAELADVISLAAQARTASDAELAGADLGRRRGLGRVGHDRRSHQGQGAGPGPGSGCDRSTPRGGLCGSYRAFRPQLVRFVSSLLGECVPGRSVVTFSRPCRYAVGI